MLTNQLSFLNIKNVIYCSAQKEDAFLEKQDYENKKHQFSFSVIKNEQQKKKCQENFEKLLLIKNEKQEGLSCFLVAQDVLTNFYMELNIMIKNQKILLQFPVNLQDIIEIKKVSKETRDYLEKTQKVEEFFFDHYKNQVTLATRGEIENLKANLERKLTQLDKTIKQKEKNQIQNSKKNEENQEKNNKNKNALKNHTNKDQKKGWYIFAIVFCVFFILIFLAFFISKRKKRKNGKNFVIIN